MGTLNEIGKHHSEWVKIARSLGAGSLSEDVVQDAYIKIDKDCLVPNIYKSGKLSGGYMRYLIRSVFIDIKRKEKIIFVDVEKDVSYDNEDTDFLDFKINDIYICLEQLTSEGYGKAVNIFKEVRFGSSKQYKVANRLNIHRNTVANACKFVEGEIKKRYNG